MFFRILIFVAFVPITLFLLFSYLRELFVFFTNRDAYEVLKKPKITHGEGDGPEVSTEDRLIFTYPLFILGSGALTIWLGFQIAADMQS